MIYNDIISHKDYVKYIVMVNLLFLNDGDNGHGPLYIL